MSGVGGGGEVGGDEKEDSIVRGKGRVLARPILHTSQKDAQMCNLNFSIGSLQKIWDPNKFTLIKS